MNYLEFLLVVLSESYLYPLGIFVGLVSNHRGDTYPGHSEIAKLAYRSLVCSVPIIIVIGLTVWL